MQKIKWRKNWPGVLLWLCLCVSVCGILAEAAALVLADCAAFAPAAAAAILTEYAAFETAAPAMLSVLLLALETGVCVLIFRMQNEQERRRRYRRQRRRRQAEADKKGDTAELPAVIWLFLSRAAALYLTGAQPVGDTALYEAAKVTLGGRLSLTADHASSIYTWLLSAFLKLSGNKPEAAVVLQTLLQLAAVLLFFAFVRRLSGRGASVIFLLAASVSPGFLLSCRSLSPDWMLGVILGCCLLICLRCFQGLAAGRRSRGAGAACLTGVLTGIGLWLDPVFIFIWLAVCIGALQLADGSLAERWLDAAAMTAGAALSLAAAFCAEGVWTGGSASGMLGRYIRLHTENFGFSVPGLTGTLPGGGMAEISAGWELLIVIFTVAACMLAYLAVLAFRKQEHDKTAMLTAMLIGVFVYRHLGISSAMCLDLEGLLLLAAACVGISCACELYTGGTDTASERPVIFGEESLTSAKGKENQTAADARYIPNPLPLPKRHARGKIRFDLEPPSEQMRFDRELEDGKDDFDI